MDASTFKGRAIGAQPAFVDNGFGLIVEVDGQLRVILRLTISNGKIAEVEGVADPSRLGQIDFTLFEQG